MGYFSSADDIRKQEQASEAQRLSQADRSLVWRGGVAAAIAGVLVEFQTKATTSLPAARWNVDAPEGLAPELVTHLTGRFQPFVFESHGRSLKDASVAQERYRRQYWDRDVRPLLDSACSILVFRIPYFRSSTFSEQAYDLYLSRIGLYWAHCHFDDSDGSWSQYQVTSDVELPAGWIADGWARIKYSSSVRDPGDVAAEFARQLAHTVGW